LVGVRVSWVGSSVEQGGAQAKKTRSEGRKGLTEIGDLEAAVPGHEDVLGLQVTVHDPAHVAVLEAA